MNEDPQTSFVELKDVIPSKKQRKKIYRVDCPVCGNRLFLWIIGFATSKPLGYLPICHTCGFNDWGHVI